MKSHGVFIPASITENSFAIGYLFMVKLLHSLQEEGCLCAMWGDIIYKYFVHFDFF